MTNIEEYIPILIFLIMAIILSLGAIFVYYSSIVRSLVAAVVIVLLAIEHRVYSPEIISGITLVVFGVIGWVYKKTK